MNRWHVSEIVDPTFYLCPRCGTPQKRADYKALSDKYHCPACGAWLQPYREPISEQKRENRA